MHRRRPTKAVVDALRAENTQLLARIERLQATSASGERRTECHTPGEDVQTNRRHAMLSPNISVNTSPAIESGPGPNPSGFVDVITDHNQQGPDTSPYLSVDEMGNFNSFGPSSAWQIAADDTKSTKTTVNSTSRTVLVANAALVRQMEYRLASSTDFDGLSPDLAIHLLDLHWNRQHHTFLLTYRPAIIHDLVEGGEFGSKFLLNSIFACASKFSERPEMRELTDNSQTLTSRFFNRCEELLQKENLLFNPSLSTVVGLLLLGSTYVARGITTKGWLFTGYALRMIYDLGLHIERQTRGDDIIQEEIRKRVFWGAFICDKLQSLYLGRPFAIKLRDAHVSIELDDILEENEIWTPYIDPHINTGRSEISGRPEFLTHSVSCFQRLCLLSKIMTRIIDEFYVIGATTTSAKSSLREIDDLLGQWEKNLPSGLRIGSINCSFSSMEHTPNVLCLHIIYHALIILLHRPLVADGHLRSASPPVASWKRCSEAAEAITHIVASYARLYTLRGAPYLVSYGLYVACTIHVRNLAMMSNESGSEYQRLLGFSLRWLEQLSVPNPAVAQTVRIIRKLMNDRGIVLPSFSHDFNAPQEQIMSRMEGNIDAQETSLNPQISFDFLENSSLFFNGWEGTFADDALYGFLDQNPSVNGLGPGLD